MRRRQKRQNFYEEYEPTAEASPAQESAEGKTLKKQRSAPKFNRTSECKVFEKRKTGLGSDEHRVCYISPAKNNEFATIAASVEELAYKFAIPKDMFVQSNCQKQQKVSEEQISFRPEQDLRLLISQKDTELGLLRMEIEGLRRSLRHLQGCEQKLLQREEEVSFMQKFLLEREAYISEMIENNIRIHENSVLQSKIKDQLEETLFKVHMSKASLEAKFEQCEQFWKAVIEAQAKELEGLRAGKKLAGEKKHSGKSTKENESGNMSKSSRSKCQMPSKGKIQGDRHIKHLDTNISGAENACPQRENLQADAGEGECPSSKEVIHSLEKKIRYSSIELDILRRAKMESAKINEDNEKLKAQNRKLLHRIDYLTTNFRRDRRNSDSSMDLSLSPTRQ